MNNIQLIQNLICVLRDKSINNIQFNGKFLKYVVIFILFSKVAAAKSTTNFVDKFCPKKETILQINSAIVKFHNYYIFRWVLHDFI